MGSDVEVTKELAEIDAAEAAAAEEEKDAEKQARECEAINISSEPARNELRESLSFSTRRSTKKLMKIA
jgi:hypothetical protein